MTAPDVLWREGDAARASGILSRESILTAESIERVAAPTRPPLPSKTKVYMAKAIGAVCCGICAGNSVGEVAGRTSDPRRQDGARHRYWIVPNGCSAGY
jgi:hypothetical protein